MGRRNAATLLAVLLAACMAAISLGADANSIAECPGEYEYFELTLRVVTVDGQVQTDLSMYDGIEFQFGDGYRWFNESPTLRLIKSDERENVIFERVYSPPGVFDENDDS